jgi:hypothetical protein
MLLKYEIICGKTSMLDVSVHGKPTKPQMEGKKSPNVTTLTTYIYRIDNKILNPHGGYI